MENKNLIKIVSESKIALQRILSEANMNEPVPSIYYNAYIRPIEEDLNRLEKYDKAKILIKEKHINVLNLLHFSNYYEKNSCLYHYNKNNAIKLTQDEFDLIVEVFK